MISTPPSEIPMQFTVFPLRENSLSIDKLLENLMYEVTVIASAGFGNVSTHPIKLCKFNELLCYSDQILSNALIKQGLIYRLPDPKPLIIVIIFVDRLSRRHNRCTGCYGDRGSECHNFYYIFAGSVHLHREFVR